MPSSQKIILQLLQSKGPMTTRQILTNSPYQLSKNCFDLKNDLLKGLRVSFPTNE
jgi:hypothetical protein